MLIFCLAGAQVLHIVPQSLWVHVSSCPAMSRRTLSLEASSAPGSYTLLPFLLEWFLSLGRNGCGEDAHLGLNILQSDALHPDQCWVSGLVTIFWKEKFLYWGLRALIHGYNKSLGVSLMLWILCLVNRIIVERSSLEPMIFLATGFW